MRAVWVEAAVNGPWSRRWQPGIPVSVEEIVADGIACAEAGAAIVHVHPYDEATGLQRDDPDIYEPILRGIRAETDAIVYPTLPLGAGPGAPPLTPQERFAAVAELARRGLLEWAVVDPGSANFSHRDFPDEGFVYLNPETHIRHGLALCAANAIRPAYACYEPGFTRLGAALAAEQDNLPGPVYRFMFSDDFRFGFPPQRYALDAHRRLLSDVAPDGPWMIAGLAVDVRPLIPDAVELGGHVRVGLEDAPFGCPQTNAELVADAVQRIEKAGATIATPAEVRTALASA
ncbi:MAG TPA: 3-keto-5-aminohexanoate cleavage protein [Sporichthya sp.]|nr:3-keto-5-aminohexanoate cleavage protein [Sporichthya sp.]